ncbi:MAG TPA: plastocyanin/azurin family copper-binding protein [Balneolaceae bacterium]|nr:plastocyanin/azurin family copper-binding protein [Balneolaceae bacterium]
MKTLKKLTALLTLMLISTFTLSAAVVTDTSNTDEDIRTITIIGTDRMNFSVEEITATPGERIKVILKVESRIPKSAMAHNVVFLKEGTDPEAFANASAMAADNQYIAPSFKDQIIAHTDLAGGGETVEITFTVPEQAGNYQYLCSFPGHYYAGMKGMLVFKESLATK